jgi:RNA polymerase sigma-70 factor (ECF subfamily)
MANARPEQPRDSFSERLDAATRGQEWAWREIYESLAGQVTGYLRVRGAADAEDLANEVFLQVARNIRQFEGNEASFRSWVFVIAHRRLIDARRTLNRRPVTVDEPADPVGGDVEHEALDRISRVRVEELLGQLTDDQRDVLALRIVADLPLAETARILNREIGAIKALQRRAVHSLKRLIDEGRVSL